MTTVCENRLLEAKTLEEEGNFVDALKVYRDVYGAEPHNQDAILGLGRVAYTIGEIEYAFEFFVKLLIENHEHPWGYWGRAAVFFEYNQPERALKELARAITFDNPATNLRIDCAVLLNNHRLFKEARQALSAYPRENYDEDAAIEWCYASIKLGLTDEYTASCLEDHASDEEDEIGAIWLLLRGMQLCLSAETEPVGKNMIVRALALDPDLSERL